MKRGRLVAGTVLFMSCAACAFAQPRAPEIEWSRTYCRPMEDYCWAVRQTSDGGYLLAGSTEQVEDASADFWLVRTDAIGDCVWSRTYGNLGPDDCLSMELTRDGGCVMAGYTFLSGAGGLDFWVVKTDAEGDSQWSRSFGGVHDDVCRAVVPADDGGYLLAGATESYGAGSLDVWLVKTDSLGESLWSRTFGGYADDVCFSAQRTRDGGYILGGSTWTYGVGWFDIWLIKTDANGDSEWSRTMGGMGTQVCWCVQQTTDGGFILGGREYEASNSSLDDAFILKTTALGDCVWQRTFGGPLDDIAFAVRQLTDGGYVVVTMTTLNPGIDVDAEVIRTNAIGDSLWSMRLGGPAYDALFDIQGTTDGGFIFAGYVDDMEHVFTDMWLVKTGPELSATARSPVRDFMLLTNYPNPFNSTTHLEFTLPATQRVSLRLYDVLGREVAVMMDEIRTAGKHEMMLDASGLASGVYWCRLEAGGVAQVRKMALVR